MARIKRSADHPKTFRDVPGLPIGTLVASPRGLKPLTFWHGSERDCLNAISREYVENDRQPWTVRHYMYVLKNAGLLKTATNVYPHSATNADNWVSSLLASARESLYWGSASWRMVADPGVMRDRFWHSAPLRKHIAELGDTYYVADRWRGQSTRVVLCTEKEGLFSFLQSIADPYGVDVLAFGGNESVTVKHDAAQEWQALLDRGQSVQLLYVGDLDPGGIDIERDFYEALCRYGYRGVPPQRIAVTPAQVAEIAPESEQPINADTNTKAMTFHQLYPQVRYGYQVEGLPGRRLHALVVQAIQTFVDVDALNDAIVLGNTVGEWLTDHVRAAIETYEHYVLERPLHEAILEPGQLFDSRTGDSFPQDVVRRYLAEGADDHAEQ